MIEKSAAALFALLLFVEYAPSQSPSDSTPLTVVAHPENPFIETRDTNQIVNFDVLVSNRDSRSYKLVAFKISVYDKSGKLELARELNRNGHPPALDLIAPRDISPKGVSDIFQPFYAFDANIDLSRMDLRLLFMREGQASAPIPFSADETVTLSVKPQSYSPKPFCMPLRGPLLVLDGHDFYSHHRRFDLSKQYQSNPQKIASPNLYAYDFVTTDDRGQLFHGDPKQPGNWLTYGKQVFTPDAGIVVETVTDLPENAFNSSGNAQIPTKSEKRDPSGLGNHVAIRHSDGRVSWLLHLQPKSTRVSVGDRVQVGQFVGKVGFTGDSLFPHLHFTVTSDAAYPSQSVPSYFRGYALILGSRRILVSVGQIDTGDFVQGMGDCTRPLTDAATISFPAD